MAALLGAGGAAPLLAQVAAAQHLLAGAGAGGQTAAGAGHQVAAGEGRGVQPEGAGAARFVAQVPGVELSINGLRETFKTIFHYTAVAFTLYNATPL